MRQRDTDLSLQQIVRRQQVFSKIRKWLIIRLFYSLHWNVNVLLYFSLLLRECDEKDILFGLLLGSSNVFILLFFVLDQSFCWWQLWQNIFVDAKSFSTMTKLNSETQNVYSIGDRRAQKVYLMDNKRGFFFERTILCYK